MTGRTAHDPHPLSPDDPGIPAFENHGLGSREINALFVKRMKAEGHIHVPHEEASAQARLHLAVLVAERDRLERGRR